MMLSGWGRYPRQSCRVSRPRDEAALATRIAEGGLIARGNGRAYGDAGLSRGNTVDMTGFNRMISFDAETGQLVAEAGVMLADVISVFLPRGWFPFVTPGTKYVTLGGMAAADVHGKNHHAEGSFARFVDWVEVMGPDGILRRAHPGDELFTWTLGGMGLTGVILRLALRLRPVESGWIRQTTIPTASLAETLAAFEIHHAAPYSVAWIDCLARGDAMGRSLLTLGAHATRAELPPGQAPFATPKRARRSVPMDAPGFALNRWTVSAFNRLYHARGASKAGEALTPWDSYFYPLDAILGWNRIYGRRGFLQFQCALPLAASSEGLTALLTRISSAGMGSFLAVLKRLGPSGGGISFPMEGHTLALDFPATPAVLDLMAELDRITLDHGGRFYLAKDARMTPETLRRSDPRAAPFRADREAKGLARAFSSSLSERLYL